MYPSFGTYFSWPGFNFSVLPSKDLHSIETVQFFNLLVCLVVVVVAVVVVIVVVLCLVVEDFTVVCLLFAFVVVSFCVVDSFFAVVVFSFVPAVAFSFVLVVASFLLTTVLDAVVRGSVVFDVEVMSLVVDFAQDIKHKHSTAVNSSAVVLFILLFKIRQFLFHCVITTFNRFVRNIATKLVNRNLFKNNSKIVEQFINSLFT